MLVHPSPTCTRILVCLHMTQHAPHTQTHIHTPAYAHLSPHACTFPTHPLVGALKLLSLGPGGWTRGAATLPRQLPVCHWPGLVHSHPWDVCAGQRLYPVTREVPVANRESSNLQLTPKMNLTTTNRLLSRDPPAQKDSTTPPRASLSSAPPHIRVLQSW